MLIPDMSVSPENLKSYNLLFAAVRASFDFVPNSSPPSPIARVRGTLRNAAATLEILESQLETREPKPADQGDLARIRSTVEQLIEDKWVADGLAAATLEWNGDGAAQSAGLEVPAKPLSYAASIAMLLDGLARLQTTE